MADKLNKAEERAYKAFRKKLKFPTKTVKTDGGEFEVRTLTPDAIEYLIGKHTAVFQELFFNIPGNVEDGVSLNIVSIINTVVHRLPECMAEIIAFGVREYDEETIQFIRSEMGISDQIKSLEAIFELTFKEPDDLKNLLETVIRVAGASMRAIRPMIEETDTQPSSNGSATSAQPLAS